MGMPACCTGMMTHMKFELKANDGSARSGTLSAAHGDIHTPAFMPVGTAGTVKAMTPEAVASTGAEIVLGNTYHLMLRPGAERVAKLGGLHKMMNWHKPILTDSGGFQVMSLSKLRKMTEQGVTFQSHIDGTKYELTPERAMEIQHLLGSDISMVLDECTPHPVTHEVAQKSMWHSMRWAERSKKAFQSRSGYGVFGIVQGNVFPDLRKASAKALIDIGFDGYAIGGLAVGEGQKVMFEVLDYTVPLLPEDKPRYLMGVGKPADIIGAVLRGVDMFDCVIPTRGGRLARAYTRNGEMNMRNAQYAEDTAPVDSACACPTCRHYSRAYLHHLFKSDEMLGPTLLTWHNLHYFQDIMRALRQAIEAGNIAQVAQEMLVKQAKT